VLDQNRAAAVLGFQAKVSVERTVIRNTQPQESDNTGGFGILLLKDSGERGSLSLSNSLLDENSDSGILALGSDAVVQGSIIRDTQPMATDQTLGSGITVGDDAGDSGTLSLSDSLLDHNRLMGLFLFGSSGTVQRTVVRSTQPQVSDNTSGRGIEVESSNNVRGSLTLTDSIVEQNHEAGVFVAASDATLERCVLRGTTSQVSDQTGGSGLVVQDDMGSRSTASLDQSIIIDSVDVGLASLGSDLTVKRTVIENTAGRASDHEFGDALLAIESQVSIETSILRHSARASVSNFGSQVSILQLAVLCSPILFDEEIQYTDVDGVVTQLPDPNYTQSAVACGSCDDTALRCVAISSQLVAPKPLKPLLPKAHPYP
jgi:hypothetical protein